MTTLPDQVVSADAARLSARIAALRAIVGWILLSGITLAGALVSYALLDLSLGTLFASLLLAAIVGVGGGAAPRGFIAIGIGGLLIGLMATIPILLAGMDRDGFMGMWIQLFVLCVTLAAACLALVSACARLIGDGLATAAGLLVMILWMTWPVWLSPTFHTPAGMWAVDHLLAYQPLIAINGVFHAMGDWSHAPIAYKWLTNLGQDSPFALPHSVWASAGVHAGIAVTGCAIIAADSFRTARRAARLTPHHETAATTPATSV